MFGSRADPSHGSQAASNIITNLAVGCYYFPSQTASPLFGWNKIIQLDEVCEQPVQSRLPTVAWPVVELTTILLQVQCLNYCLSNALHSSIVCPVSKIRCPTQV